MVIFFIQGTDNIRYIVSTRWRLLFLYLIVKIVIHICTMAHKYMDNELIGKYRCYLVEILRNKSRESRVKHIFLNVFSVEF